MLIYLFALLVLPTLRSDPAVAVVDVDVVADIGGTEGGGSATIDREPLGV